MYLIVTRDMGFYKWFASAHAPCDEAF